MTETSQVKTGILAPKINISHHLPPIWSINRIKVTLSWAVSLFDHWPSKLGFHAFFAAVELVDNVENQPWFQHSSERAQKQQLKKIKDSIRAITRSKTVSSGKKVKSGNYKFMSEKEARRIRKPRKQLGNRFGNENGNDGYFWVGFSCCL